MTQEHRILTTEMALMLDEAMLKAGNDQVVTVAAIADRTGYIGCHVFIVPPCMNEDVRTAIRLHTEKHSRANHAGDD